MNKTKEIIRSLQEDDHELFITREDVFSSAHRLYSEDLSEAENFALFGKCMNENGHGHNYKYKVTLKIKPNKKTGMLMNLTELKQIMRDNVTELFDHKNLNLDVEIFKTINPTTENLAIVIWYLLEDKLPKNSLFKISVSSGDKNEFSYYGKK